VCEAYTFDKPIRYHLAYTTLRDQAARIGCRRLVVTHMGPEMLGRLGEIECEHAEDGARLAI